MKVSFKVEFETFTGDDVMTHDQVSKILFWVGERVKRGFTAGTIKDENGKKIGEFFWDNPDEEEEDY